MNVIDYKHLNDAELKARVEHYGTENERELMRRFTFICPDCESRREEINGIRTRIDDAIAILEPLAE